MGKLSVTNVKHASPSWMVNLTGILAVLTPILPGLISTMPTGVPQPIKDWLLWVLATITAISGALTMFAKRELNPSANNKTEENGDK